MVKKKTSESLSLERETRVVLEEMHPDIKKIAEGHSLLVAKLNEHDKRFDAIDKRFDMLETAVSENGRSIKQNHEAITRNTEAIKQNHEAITRNTEAIKQNHEAITRNSEGIKQINEKLDKVITDHEDRLQKLESVHH